jgi:hypothetical protein
LSAGKSASASGDTAESDGTPPELLLENQPGATLMLGLTFLTTTVTTAFAQEQKKEETTEKKAEKKKTPKNKLSFRQSCVRVLKPADVSESV